MRTLLASALFAAGAAIPFVASAQQVNFGAAAALAHFNQDADSQDERVWIQGAGLNGTQPLLRPGDSHEAAFAHFNKDADGQDGMSGQAGVTVLPGEPIVGRDIFDSISSE